jgi:hypothetical protein
MNLLQLFLQHLLVIWCWFKELLLISAYSRGGGSYPL